MSSKTMLDSSLINCHGIGLDSIVLKGAPGMVRVFIARPEHELWKNSARNGHLLSLGLHAHHCDLVLTPLFGEVFNVTRGGFGHLRELQPYGYESGVTGAGHFFKLGAPRHFRLEEQRLYDPTPMKAGQAHTIALHRGLPAAWLVCEGKEDPRYLPITYSDADLTAFDFSHHYLPMTEQRLAEALWLLAKNGVNLG